MKKLVILLLSAMLCVGSITGCGLKLDSESRNAVASLNDEYYSLDELKVYVYMYQYGSEKELGSTFASLFGSMSTYWSYAWDSAITSAISEFYQTKVLVAEANKNGVSLTTSDETKVEIARSAFLRDSGTAFEAYTGISGNSDLVRQYFLDNALANKYYDALIADIDTTDPNDDSVRGKKFSLLSITPKSSKTIYAETGETDADGAAVTETATEAISDEDQTANLEAAMEEAEKLLAEGKTYSEIAETLNTYGTLTVYTTDEMYALLSMVEENSYPYIAQAWSMSTGDEWHGLLENSSGGQSGYFLTMIDDNDAEEHASLLSDLLDERRDERFNEVFNTLRDGDYKNFKVDTDKLANLTYQGDLYPLEDTTSDTTAAAETEAASSETESK